jgi:hypothetical protein
MIDAWAVYATPYEPTMAFVSFNQGYADEAAKDPRTMFLTVDLPMKKPRADGLSSSEEAPTLASVEDQLTAALQPESAIEVGRRTGGGRRIFYYYVSGSEDAAAKAVAALAARTTYALHYTWKADPRKDGYWKTVHPDADGQQVMGDLSVLDSLADKNDDVDAPRDVQHWSYFADGAAARKFAAWATQAGYSRIDVARSEDDAGETVVTFFHRGTMRLTDISARTVRINREARRLGGRYDGWETAIVRQH